MLVEGFLECLGVIKGILISEGHADNQEQEKESDAALPEGGLRVLVR